MRRTISGAVAGLLAALALTACGGDDGGDNPLAGGGEGGGGNVVVGSANFPESSLLGEIYAQALEAEGIGVTRKFDIGAREVYYDQVVKGGLDVMPEYNGALLTVAVDEKSKATTTDDINAELKQKLPTSVEVLDSAAAEDKDSVTVTSETAKKYDLETIADLKGVAGDLAFGGPSEIKTRYQGIVGLKELYGVEFAKFQPVDAGAQATLVDLLTKGDIQAANLFTTDPAIAAEKLVVLEDPKHLYAAQNVTPLIHKDSVGAKAKDALNAVSAELTTQDLLDMMERLVIDKEDPATVAEDWLTEAGITG